MKLIDFSEYEQAFERFYGGASCRKLDIIYQGEHWFLKFPGNIRGQVKDMSYSNSSVSEYIGSHIYELLGYEVHETLLGIYGDKCVVACKDFLGPDESQILEFGRIKTTFLPAFLDSNGNETNGNGTDFEEILKTLEEHPLIQKYPEMKNRFWDMFVVDAFIGNNDRNNGNWGLIEKRGGEYRLAPVYDNGSSFLPKTSEAKMQRILTDPAMFRNLVYSGYTSVFEYHGHRMNPLKYILETKNKDCVAAVQRNVPRIQEHMGQIHQLIQDIPENFKGVSVILSITKQLYLMMLDARCSQVLIPVLNKVAQEKDEKEKINPPKPVKKFKL